MVTIRIVIRGELNMIGYYASLPVPNRTEIKEHISNIDYLLFNYPDLSTKIDENKIDQILKTKPIIKMKKTAADFIKERFSSKNEVFASTISEIEPYLERLADEMKLNPNDLKVLNRFFELIEEIF